MLTNKERGLPEQLPALTKTLPDGTITMSDWLKETWALTLESGKYEQGTSALRRENNSSCCLGVLLDIVSPKGWCNFKDNKYAHRSSGSDEYGMPSASFYERVGLTKRVASELAHSNDNGANFKEIAETVRKLP
jgi:hypothetical protein